jgi:hypothetical protein
MSAAALIADALDRPVPAEIRAFASALLSGRTGVAAILAYGSCLRGVATTDSLIDLYVLTDDLAHVSGTAVSRLACRLVPPNVYYAEHELDGVRYRAKFAVLPLAQFARGMVADNPYFWARFAQPSALVYAASDKARGEVTEAILQAARTMLAAARGLTSSADSESLWAAGFSATYETELRPEAASRAAAIVAANRDYYLALTAALADVTAAPANWRARARRGKLWSIARLAKAAFTFTGGADYIAWKIERHSGQRFTPSPWQRKHPLLAGILMLPLLLKRGAIR